MRRILLSFFLVAFAAIPLTAGDDFCGLRNTTFNSGESLTFKVYYTAAGIYLPAGDAFFNVSSDRVNNKPVYHITAEGRTLGFYDNFFKVRDKYESFIDTATLQPYKFIRNVYEGGYTKLENVTFNQAANTAVSSKATIKVPSCIQDVVSSFLQFSSSLND